MRRIDMKWILFTLALSSGPALTQQAGSTLEQLSRHAPIILEARVTHDHSDGSRRLVQFKVLRQVRGSCDSTLSLSEPAQAHCGSMLFGLRKDERYWIFARSQNGQLLPIGARRGIVLASEARAQAIEALLRVAQGASRLRVLAEQLTSRDPRVSRDAALALPHLPGLESAAAVVRAKIRQQVGQAIATADATTPQLLLAYARSEPKRAARLAWSIVAKPPLPEFERPAAQLLLRILPAKIASATTPIATETHPERQLRMARVLVALDTVEARNAARLWQSRSQGTSHLHATATLMALGAAASPVERKQNPREFAEATRLAEKLRPQQRFRAIRP
ncbi:MAG: hypothetical protein CSA62_06945 [Planctomycetota bacterium]|nr:MAG: hypothetical protein CSA62_06945 [Planctomycetota bacterium]